MTITYYEAENSKTQLSGGAQNLNTESADGLKDGMKSDHRGK
jgi:hypothetical protein